MSTYNYDSINNTAITQITAFGTSFTITRTGDGGDWTKKFDNVEQRVYWEDDESNIVYTVPEDAESTYTGICVITDFENDEIDGSLIKRGDKRLVSKIDTTSPQLNDKITVDSVNYEYINHKSIAPDGDNIIHLIQVRI